VPDAPGRVVTLVPVTGARCGGMAFEIKAAHADRIFKQLDYREKNGYQRCQARLCFDHDSDGGNDSDAEQGIFYVAGDRNPAYLGPASAESIAKQISESTGPSGSNLEYLLELAQALRLHKIDDRHVFEIEAALKKYVVK